MSKVSVLQGVADVLPFRIRDPQTGRWLDMTGATFLLWVKRTTEDASPIFIKEDEAFEKGGVASGFVSVFLESRDTFQPPWTYKAELRITKTGTPVPVKKIPFDLAIERAVTPSDLDLVALGISSLEDFDTPVVMSI
jgi:hypothetical protein